MPRGDAKELMPNSEIPRIGGVVILKYGSDSHVAYIFRVTGEGLFIGEGNFDECEYTERLISFDDPAIVGYWHETL